MKNILLKFALVLVIFLPVNDAFADQVTHRQAAAALLDSMNLNETMIATGEKLVDLEIQRNPQLSLFKDVMIKFFNKHMTGDVLYDDMAKMYMEEFTEAELNDLTAFYKTATGQKSIEKLPILTQKGAQWGQKQVRDNISELQQMIAEETKRIKELQKTSK